VFGLQPVGQNAIQKMTGQVRGWPPPKDAVPTSPKPADVEIAQARNLDIQHAPVRRCRTDLDARHDVPGYGLDERAPVFPLLAPAIQ
jgi:hypothetical protein